MYEKSQNCCALAFMILHAKVEFRDDVHNLFDYAYIHDVLLIA